MLLTSKIGGVMEYADRDLKCSSCGVMFVFSAGEQQFFHERAFVNDPKHCKQCKAKRLGPGRRARIETRLNCSACGLETTVPFKPTQQRPVLCAACFRTARAVTPAP